MQQLNPSKPRLIAEFEPQSFVQLIFPHSQSDWVEYLEEARECFVNIVIAIAKTQTCLIVCDHVEKVKSYFSDRKNLEFVQYQSDDTWARDCSAITVEVGGVKRLLDFTFNGWGAKFKCDRDNALTSIIATSYESEVETIPFILEGGSIESNGNNILLTTSKCLLNQNRNSTFTKEKVEKKLYETLGVTKILWLEHGYLAGDDTDSHIDTLARFISENEIMYVKCVDESDEHFIELQKMENELKELKDHNNKAFKLIPLPMCDTIYFENERLPATYANFLMINSAVLVPTYNTSSDQKALEVFESSFRDREIVPIDCSVLIKQHGSLHCVTMQF
ncbi:MAG: agmatine deiminase [Helicobacteraceae bacterium]|nr:agmatine deiminase [Helicobacteraceae bacterium]